MPELWGVLAPILVTDALNPALLAAVVFALGTTRPLSASTMMLIGHTIAYFISGIVLVVALDRIVEFIENPEPWHYGVSGLVGAVLVWFFVQSSRSDVKPSERKVSDVSELRPMAAFSIGAVVNLTGLPSRLRTRAGTGL